MTALDAETTPNIPSTPKLDDSMNPTLIIRPANPDDADTIAAFNCEMAWETEKIKLDSATVRRGVDRGITLQFEVQYFVACAGNQIAGTLMLTREWSDWRCGWLYWLQSVYVTPPSRGIGVFRSMLDHVVELLQSNEEVAGMRL